MKKLITTLKIYSLNLFLNYFSNISFNQTNFFKKIMNDKKIILLLFSCPYISFGNLLKTFHDFQ